MAQARGAGGRIMGVVPISPTMRGVGLFMLAMLFFSAMNVSIRSLHQDMHALQMVFIRSVFSMVFMLPLLAKHGLEAARTEQHRLHLWRAVVGLIGMQAWFYTLTQLPVNTATAISFTAPLFGTMLAVIFLGESIGVRRVVALCIGFGGVLVIANPWDEMQWHHAIPIALFSACMIAGAGVLVKKLTRTEPSWRIVLYMTVLMSILSFPAALFVWQPASLQVWAILALIGLLSTLAQLCMVAAFRHASMVVLMPFDFTRLLFTASLAWMMLSEPLSPRALAGSALIIASAAFIAWREQRANAKGRS